MLSRTELHTLGLRLRRSPIRMHGLVLTQRTGPVPCKSRVIMFCGSPVELHAIFHDERIAGLLLHLPG